MKSAAQIALLVIAIALLAGAVWSASRRIPDVALFFLCLAILCGMFERILAVGGDNE